MGWNGAQRSTCEISSCVRRRRQTHTSPNSPLTGVARLLWSSASPVCQVFRSTPNKPRQSRGSWLAMRGVPMGVIAAQLGHADTRMTEKHYAHLAPSYVAQTIRATFPDLGIGDAAKVVPLRRVVRGA